VTDDRGAAALAERLPLALSMVGKSTPVILRTHMSLAILGEHGRFLPDGGLEATAHADAQASLARLDAMEAQAEVERLREALDRERALTGRHHRDLQRTRRTCSHCWESDHLASPEAET